jgi:hypothetical protein
MVQFFALLLLLFLLLVNLLLFVGHASAGGETKRWATSLADS